MALVNVMVNARAYTIACDDGEEEHLRELAGHVDAKVREVLETVGQVGDQRLMLMAALLVADEAFEAKQRLEARRQELGDLADTHEAMSEALEAAAKRAEALVAGLAQA
jgi:cell division protein ZapA